MLNPELLRIGPEAVSREIRQTGFFAFERALLPQPIEAIHKELNLWEFPFNANDVHAVANRYSNYFCHILARSHTLYNLLTHPYVLDLAAAYNGPQYRLKAQRVYSVFAGTDMPWHSDNKAFGHKRDYEGLIFIFYLKDVIDGEFQIIRGSHLWSPEHTFSNFDGVVIDRKYKDDIVSFKMPMGSLIVYNERAVHRAKPITRSDWFRTSLFFQIDNVVDNGEKILLNSAFLRDVSPRVQQYLGFGQPSNYPLAPDTTLAAFRPKQLVRLQWEALVALGRFYADSLRGKIPREWKHRIKRMLGRPVEWNTG